MISRDYVGASSVEKRQRLGLVCYEGQRTFVGWPQFLLFLAWFEVSIRPQRELTSWLYTVMMLAFYQAACDLIDAE
jgi:hypothetical protein